MTTENGGVVREFDLKTLEGIAEAREYVFSQLMAGAIPEQRAREAERSLRGQQDLKGTLRLKFLALIMGNKKFEPFAQELAMGISGFVNGRPALPSGE